MDDAARRDRRLLARFRGLLLLFVALLAVAELLAACALVPEPLGSAVGRNSFAQFLSMALLGTFVIHVWVAPGRRERSIALAAGLTAELLRVAWCHAAGWSAAAIAVETGFAAGLASLAVQGWFVARASGDERTRRLVDLTACLAIDGFVLLSSPYVSLTTPLHPLTLDGLVWAFDGTLGLQPSFLAGRLFLRFPSLEPFVGVFYLGTPFALALVWAAQRRVRARPPIDVMTAFLVASAAGFALYHAFPVAGPRYALPDAWPLLSSAQLDPAPMAAPPVPRNCVPSLHTTWVLLLWWHTRGRGPLLRAFAAVVLALTLMATLGLGFHYAIDLVIAVPFAAAVQAACAPATAESRRALAVCGAMVALWLALLRAGVLVHHPLPLVSWLCCVASVAAAVWLERRVWLAAAAVTVVEPPLPARAADAPLNRAVVVAFFTSGFAGLLYEVVFDKQLALTFGSTARAATTVLATYMGGIALGAWFGGRLGARRRDALRLYAACEGAIGLICAASPLFFRGVRAVYVLLARGGDPARPSLVALQLALGAAVLLPPTFLMGVTMPVLARHFSDRRQSLGVSMGTLYGANTLGAALGALVTGYLLLPLVGVAATIWLAVAANLLVALVALRLHERAHQLPAADGGAEASVATAPRRQILPFAILTVGGVISLALEIVYVHLLAVVAGNSAYAFSLMLACFLAALGAGATVMRRVLAAGRDAVEALAWCELGVAACLLAGVFLWNVIPDYFASFAHYPAARSFGAREVVRFAVCAVAMIPPAACIGAAYVAVMEWIGRATDRPVAAAGRGAALNTAGNIVGALAGAPLVARLGSLHALELLAAGATLLGVAAAAAVAPRRRWHALAPLAAVVALAVAQPRSFDLTRLASGANVYFASQTYGDVIASAESLDGGLTTIAQSFDQDGQRVLTLLTNGKFQGDDSVRREMAAQQAFARVPLAHTTARGRALVIGLGTGVTADALADASFAALDVVELSRDVVALADRWLGRVNHGVLHRRGIATHVTDGRNWLMLTRDRYDIITIELSSIWFAGAAALYNREFYQLCRAALSHGGVLQQWLQLHRLAPEDLAVALASLRAVFPHVYLYVVGNQGLMVACAEACPPNAGAAPPPLLDGDGIERLITAVARATGQRPDELVSTDDNLFLEYHTPRANVRAYAPSLRANLRFVESFAAP